MSTLQAALPAPFYVDEGHWRREKEQVLHRDWFCAGPLTTYALEAGRGGSPQGPGGRVAVLDVVGESVLVTRAEGGELWAI